MASAMYSRKMKKFPKIPSTLEEFEAAMAMAPPMLSGYYRQMVKLGDDYKGAIFAHPELLKVLEDSTDMAQDGTFFVVPMKDKFYQLYILFFTKDSYFFPGACILLTGKKREIYDAMWDSLLTLIPGFSPINGIADFEIAARSSAHSRLERLKIVGCWFHYAQAVFKNLIKLGLSKLYAIRGSAFRTWAKKIMAIPLLRADFIHQAFDDLLEEAVPMPSRTDARNFLRFKQYIRRQWRLNVTTPPDILSVFDREIWTNNGAESINSIFKKEIKKSNPCIWTFLYHLNLILQDQYVNYLRYLDDPEDYTRARDPQLQAKIDDRKLAEEQLTSVPPLLTIDNFLIRVSHFNQNHVVYLQNQERNDPQLTFLQRDPDVFEENDEVVVQVNDPLEVLELPNGVEVIVQDLVVDVQPAPIQPAPVQQEQQQQGKFCTVCYTVKEDWSVLGCGHQFCRSCITRVQQGSNFCPVCRHNIEIVIPLHNNSV